MLLCFATLNLDPNSSLELGHFLQNKKLCVLLHAIDLLQPRTKLEAFYFVKDKLIKSSIAEKIVDIEVEGL